MKINISSRKSRKEIKGLVLGEKTSSKSSFTFKYTRNGGLEIERYLPIFEE